MKIKTINKDKLLIFNDKQLRVYQRFSNGAKYRIWDKNKSIFSYNKDRKLINFQVRCNNWSIDNDGHLIYVSKDGCIYGMGLLKPMWYDDKNHIPKTVITKANKILKTLIVN